MPNWKKVVVSGSSAQLLNITASGQVSASLGIHGVLQTPNSIDSDNYVDGSIDAAHLADDAVTADKLAANAGNGETEMSFNYTIFVKVKVIIEMVCNL